MKILVMTGLLLLVPTALSGCGAGSKLFKNVDLKVDADATGGATAALTGVLNTIRLPALTLPLRDPRDPSRVLGELETQSDRIIARVDIDEALRFPIEDGRTLPNGALIPISLPTGAVPIAIPVLNSHSRVYVHVTAKQIMVGAAVGIEKFDVIKNPLNLFLPFSFNGINGAGGVYLGEKQGIGLFALKDFASSSIQSFGIQALSDETMKVKTKVPTRSQMRRLQSTWNNLDEVRLD